MEYSGLTEDVLGNVRALNRTWLRLATNGADGFSTLDDKRRARLAMSPFLLFSLREGEAIWSELLADRAQRELFAERPGYEQRELQSACLAYLWELTRRNPFAARVVSGAPLQWCERIAEMALVRLLRSAGQADLIRPRFEMDSPMYRRLLLRGGSAMRSTRDAAQIAALQTMLTTAEFAALGRLPAAACEMRSSVRRVADKL